MPMRTRIGITIGDPAGIGPEIIRGRARLREVAEEADYAGHRRVRGLFVRQADPGERARRAGCAREAARRALAGELDAVVTGPIHKARMYEIGFRISRADGVFRRPLRRGKFRHAPDRRRPHRRARDHAYSPSRGRPKNCEPTRSCASAIAPGRFSSRRRGRGRIAVAGINPHAGESGALGREEIELIAPAIAELNRSSLVTHHSSLSFSGPFSPDTIFHRAVAGEFDAVLCMYHDQGLIPLKLHAFHEGVNVTLGLPFPRTSPDHGTAFEIAGQRYRPRREHDRRHPARGGTGRARTEECITESRRSISRCSSLTGLVFAWSAWRPYDRLTWWLEDLPGMLGAAILIVTYSPVPFHHARLHPDRAPHLLLCVGGHYTYARVPLFEWLEAHFRLAAKPFRSARPFRAGLRPGPDRARAFHPARVVTARRLDLCHRHSWFAWASAPFTS